MKKIKFLIPIILTILSFAACKKCEDPVMEPCGTFTPNSEFCGWSVATCYTEEGGGDVAAIFDTRYNSQAIKGDDWGTQATPVTAIHPSNWKLNQIGQVFGTAIDKDQNIYLASSDIYFYSAGLLGIPSSNGSRPYSAGQIFKCVPPSFTAVPLGAPLPNANDPLNGIGNIAYDKWNDQLIATNLEDGKIYRLSTTTGAVLETFDPWAADTGSLGIVANQDERVWGIGVNYENGAVKVYFPRVSSMGRMIYSVTLVGGAFPAAGSEVIEIPSLPGRQLIVSDLAFSSNGEELLIAEHGHPHESKVISYSLNGTSWSFNTQYFVGSNAGLDGENSAGGVDFAYTEQDENVSAVCDEFFWTTGNFMAVRNGAVSLAYGMQGIDYSGNNSASTPAPNANQDTDLFIDFDGFSGTGPKGTIGDVEVFDCYECIDPCTLNDYPN